MSQAQELKDVINFAIENEQEAADFYRELLNHVTSEAVADEIREIIKMEEGHRDQLKKIDVGAFTRSLVDQSVDLNIADFIIEAKPKPNMSMKDLLNLAMHRERQAVELYTDLAKLFSGDAKRLFENLAAEEGNHKHFFEVEWRMEMEE